MPILIYLKSWSLSEFPQQSNSILEMVRKDLALNGRDVSISFAELVLRSSCALLLDGFDELPTSIQNQVINEIRDISIRFPYLHIVLTSRPESILSGLEKFCTLYPVKLQLKQISNILSRLVPETDQERVTSFIDYVRRHRSVAVSSFTSTPLLGIMCFMVYVSQGMIESAYTSFYNQVVYTLWLTHDQTKGFVRNRPNGCDFATITLILEYVCQKLYRTSKLTYDSYHGYTRSQVLELIEEALRGFGLSDVKADDVFHVITSSMCIMHTEGNLVEYSHRTFEEYFVGLYVSKVQQDSAKWSKWVDVLRDRASDSIFHAVVFELCRIKYIHDLLLPEIDELLRRYNKAAMSRDQSIKLALKNCRIALVATDAIRITYIDGGDDDRTLRSIFTHVVNGGRLDQIMLEVNALSEITIPQFVQEIIGSDVEEDCRIFGQVEGPLSYYDKIFHYYIKIYFPESLILAIMNKISERTDKILEESNDSLSWSRAIEACAFGFFGELHGWLESRKKEYLVVIEEFADSGMATDSF